MGSCTCRKAQEQLFKFFNNWVKSKEDDTLFSEDIINIVYEYFCKQKTVTPHLDHGKQYIDLSDQDVNTNLPKFMQKISILGDKIIWEGEGEVDFYRIKELYKENFNNYQEIE